MMIAPIRLYVALVCVAQTLYIVAPVQAGGGLKGKIKDCFGSGKHQDNDKNAGANKAKGPLINPRQVSPLRMYPRLPDKPAIGPLQPRGKKILACILQLDAELELKGIPEPIERLLADIAAIPPGRSWYMSTADRGHLNYWIHRLERPAACDEHEKYFEKFPCLAETALTGIEPYYDALYNAVGPQSLVDKSIGSVWACRSHRLGKNQSNIGPVIH